MLNWNGAHSILWNLPNGLGRFLPIGLVSWLFIGTSAVAATCEPSLLASRPASYRLLSFNVENLFMRAGPYRRVTPTELAPVDLGPRNRSLEKDPASIAKIAAIIRSENPDFMVLTEVEGQSAERFNQEFLNGEYDVRCVKGNDSRGIEIAMLVRKSLGFEIEYRSFKDQTWKDPARGGQTSPLFARDFPVMILRQAGKAQPSLILTGQHAKSMRDRPGDPNSMAWRTAEYDAKGKILRNLKKEFPGVTLVTAGDFNTEVRAASGRQGKELRALVGIMKDSFDVAAKSVPLGQRITHSYFPMGEENVVSRQQMDTVMIDLADGASVEAARVIPFLNEKGKPMGLPRSYEERSLQPSDHNPVAIDFTLPN